MDKEVIKFQGTERELKLALNGIQAMFDKSSSKPDADEIAKSVKAMVDLAKSVDITTNLQFKFIFAKFNKTYNKETKTALVKFDSVAIQPSNYVKYLVAQARYQCSVILVKDKDEYRWRGMDSKHDYAMELNQPALRLVVTDNGDVTGVKGLKCIAYEVRDSRGKMTYPPPTQVSDIVNSINSSPSISSPEYSPWFKHTDQMVRKTGWLRLGKELKYHIGAIAPEVLDRIESTFSETIDEPASEDSEVATSGYVATNNTAAIGADIEYPESKDEVKQEQTKEKDTDTESKSMSVGDALRKSSIECRLSALPTVDRVRLIKEMRDGGLITKAGNLHYPGDDAEMVDMAIEEELKKHGAN